MIDLGPLFNGTAQRDDALKRVEDHASEAWKGEADFAVLRLAATGRPFTADDVWRGIPAGFTTHEPRAMGAILRGCARDGIIEALQEWKLSTRPECHRRPVRVWRGTNTEVFFHKA